MKQVLPVSKRKQLEKKMIRVFKEEVETLPPKLQQILADDLVTAFQNRLVVFARIQPKTEKA